MRRRLVAVVLGALLLGGCAEPESSPAPAPGPSRVEVDTAELRAAKRAAGVEQCAPGSGEPVEGGLPELVLPCFGGGPEVDLSSLRGPLVLNLWAGWCAPCRRELPVLQAFHERYGDRVAVVGVNTLETQPRLAMDLITETGVTFPLLADVESALQTADPVNVRALPTTVLVDADGVVRQVAPVEIESERQLLGLVERHLGVRL